MSLDPSATAAVVVGMKQSQISMQMGVSMLKHQAQTQQAVANAIISATSQVYNAQGRTVAAAGQLLNGRG